VELVFGSALAGGASVDGDAAGSDGVLAGSCGSTFCVAGVAGFARSGKRSGPFCPQACTIKLSTTKAIE
jgi:hypothetical protein